MTLRQHIYILTCPYRLCSPLSPHTQSNEWTISTWASSCCWLNVEEENLLSQPSSHLAPSCAFSLGSFSSPLESRRKPPGPSMLLALASRAMKVHFIHTRSSMVPEKHQNVIIVQGLERLWWVSPQCGGSELQYAGQVGNQQPTRKSCLCSQTTPTCVWSNKLIMREEGEGRE